MGNNAAAEKQRAGERGGEKELRQVWHMDSRAAATVPGHPAMRGIVTA